MCVATNNIIIKKQDFYFLRNTYRIPTRRFRVINYMVLENFFISILGQWLFNWCSTVYLCVLLKWSKQTHTKHIISFTVNWVCFFSLKTFFSQKWHETKIKRVAMVYLCCCRLFLYTQLKLTLSSLPESTRWLLRLKRSTAIQRHRTTSKNMF